ncbi:hypothetical protein Bca52824_036199 [Brassica carinata]|uniref:non-specific serine/threonine protein kinase n=1 Tax=Brassica carinata TaxID=52824 RepID=A0A8X7S4S7_BRACI|nr:hypothetical protein Bca52824_036199 [Brassica carinata]
MDSSGTINGRDGDLNEQDPFDNNEFLNYAWLNNIQIPDNLYPQDSNPHPVSPPRLTHFTFRWQEILDGTQNLLNTNLLIRGNSSEVYLCDFPRFDKVGAAKIRDLQDEEAHPEFVAEIKALHRPNHPNLVKLLGKCVNREHCVVVHEFMPKGSLDCYLFAGSKTNRFWIGTRMRIAVGVAEARASKVLLDEDFVPKLSGFGLATRIVENEHGVEQQQTEIHRVKGSPGCIAPETERFGLVSSKSDVYSYGVFLLSLFTGREDFDLEKLGWARKLTNWLVPVLSREECMPVVADVALAKRYSVEGLVRLFHVARMCMDEEVGAAKIRDLQDEEAHPEFVAEIKALQTNHPNLVKLRQIVNRNTAWSSTSSCQRLSTATSLLVVKPIGFGLVLLDEDFVPKLSGFGLATRIVENEHGVEQQQTEIHELWSFPVIAFPLEGKILILRNLVGQGNSLIGYLVPVLSREECMPVVADVALAKRYSVEDANPHPLSPPRLTHFTFRWQEILDGTQNLLNSEVYLCDFPRFDKVGAAKIRDLQDGEAHPEFVAEIKALHRPNHPNLVKLLGKCVNREHCVVVHEFMPKGSLDCYLFAGSKTNPVLDWYTRMRIAVGVAEALVYVHDDELKMIHRDVRASKVLLDEDFVPKLSGFGLATRIVESEHGVEQQQTEIHGLWSFPVIAFPLEGKILILRNLVGQGNSLIGASTQLVPVLSREECMPVVADVALAKRYSVEGLVRLFHVARMCMDEEGVVSSYFSDEERSPEELIVRNQSSSLRQATLLSGFASSETEASQDVSAYLRCIHRIKELPPRYLSQDPIKA